MSADLFKEFGGPPTSSNSAQSPSQNAQYHPRPFPASNKQATSRARNTEEPLWKASEEGNDVLFDADANEDDDFGDFEDVSFQRSSNQPAIAEPSVSKAARSEQSADPLIDLLSLDDAPSLRSTAHARTEPLQMSSLAAVSPSQMNAMRILSTDDDEWGDFEAGSGSTTHDHHGSSTAATTANTPALSIKTAYAESGQVEEAWDSFEDGPSQPAQPLKPTTLRQNQPNKQQAPTSPPPEEDDWQPFDDPPLPPLQTQLQQTTPTPQPTTSIPPSATRPTNLPPPSILLSWLTTLFPSSPNTLPPPSPSTILLLHLLTARITAGRTLRWRRDTLLSQSLRISDTTSGAKTSGMKLSSLSKTETARESREAAETLAAWNKGVPRYQAILREAGVKTPGGKGLKLSMPLGVKTLGSGQGGMEAGYICPVCGLKRNERVVGVEDGEGEVDVFGEWWREGWGHVGCAEGWYRWKDRLGQR